MPIHWGLFNLAFHDWFQPPERVTQLAAAAQLPLWLPIPGEPTEFTGEPTNTQWWRAYMSPAHERNEHPMQATAKGLLSGKPTD